MMAAFTKVEELAIDEKEAKAMADAIADVASHYNTVIDPKMMAWFGLATAMGSVYGPRFAAIKMRKSIENATKKGNGEINPVSENNIVGIHSANAPVAAQSFNIPTL